MTTDTPSRSVRPTKNPDAADLSGTQHRGLELATVTTQDYRADLRESVSLAAPVPELADPAPLVRRPADDADDDPFGLPDDDKTPSAEQRRGPNADALRQLGAGLCGPMPDKLAISTFNSWSDTDPKDPDVTWSTWSQSLLDCRKHPRSAEKQGKTWSPAAYKTVDELKGKLKAGEQPSRRNEHVRALSAIGFDFDHAEGEDSYQVVVALAAEMVRLGIAYAYHPSYSDKADEPKFRFIIPLAEPVPADQWPNVFAYAQHYLAGGAADEKTKDPSRQYNLPRHPIGGSCRVPAHAEDGGALVWRKLLTLDAPPQQSARAGNAAADGAAHVRVRGRRLSARVSSFLLGGAEIGRQRGEALAAARVMKTQRYTQEQAAAAILPALRDKSPQRAGDKPWTEQDVLELVESIYSSEAPPLPPESFALTDTGNAERFAAEHGAYLRHCDRWGSWLVYDGRRWSTDERQEVPALAKETIRRMREDAAALEDKAARENAQRWAARSEQRQRRDAMLALAQSEDGIQVHPTDLDHDPWTFNVRNGTLDLRTGELRPHSPADLLTRLADVVYDPDASAETWLRFVERILPDERVRNSLQEWAGVCLTGDVSIQKLAFMYGTGANGKSTLLATLLRLVGEYGRSAAADLLLAKQDRDITELAVLHGARLVVTSEINEGRRLDEAMVKHITGGDRLRARVLYRDSFEFDPTHKVALAANHRPEVRETGHAIWRRILFYPFEVTIPEAEQDAELVKKLHAELSGVLNWALAGLSRARANGMRISEPEPMARAVREYRAAEDVLADFVAERCVEGPTERASTAELNRAYRDWAESSGERPLPPRTLGLRLKGRGYTEVRSNSARGWAGISVKASS